MRQKHSHTFFLLHCHKDEQEREDPSTGGTIASFCLTICAFTSNQRVFVHYNRLRAVGFSFKTQQFRMNESRTIVLLIVLALSAKISWSFVPPKQLHRSSSRLQSEQDNKAMEFLKRVGRVGGKANRDLTFAMGVDEGPSGKALGTKGSLPKIQQAYPSCIDSGCIDDISQPFPTTACGTGWTGFTDTVMGGQSQASLTREDNFHGRMANVLRGRVHSLFSSSSNRNNHNNNRGGFIQMACYLHPSNAPVDASKFDGLQVDIACQTDDSDNDESSAKVTPSADDTFVVATETFNLHLKNTACREPFSSYRASFEASSNGEWQRIRIPWQRFQGYGPGAMDQTLDVSTLLRAGIVAIGKPMKVILGVSSLCFYKEIAGTNTP